jgi:threonine/homoserine/homoserine lactone efflux protein
MQIAFLGMLFTTIGIVTDSFYALAAGTAGDWLKRRPAYLKAERWVSRVVFIGLGLTAAFAGNQEK